MILGLALLLFGTGTTASGDGTSGPVKVAIAGGAGVLAMVLGFGVALWHKELTEVFMRQRDYGVLELSIKKGVNPVPVDLNNFDAVAKFGEQPLPLWKTRQKIEILVPILAGAEGLESSVTVELTPKGGFQNYALSVEDPLTIYWSKEPIGRRLGINNEFLPVINKTIKTDSAQPVAAETATGVQPPPPQIGGMAIKLD